MSKKILQLHKWRVQDITSEILLEIKNQGFTDIQISPAQEIRSHIWDWFNLYQPISFKIGNHLTGSESDLRALGERARQQGIGIIMDIVMNHMASDWGDGKPSSYIPNDIRNFKGFWHNHYRNTEDWNNRYEVTQFNLNGVPDLNTSHPAIQKAFIYMIAEYKSLGVTGFRFDAAKHIELPDDPYCGSDFWPNIINACGHSYCYGEILYEGYELMERYSKYMKVGTNWSNGLSLDKTVLWVESHDTFEDGTTRCLSDQQIEQEYLRLRLDCKQSDVLYLARPYSNSWKSEVVKLANNLS